MIGFAIAQTREIPVMFHGNPGIGKSQIVRQFAEFLGLPIFEPNILTSTPDEIGGIPTRNENLRCIEKWPPKWAAEAANLEECVIFIDEITNLRRELQAVALGVIQDRKIGDMKLSPKTIVIGAGNPIETATDGYLLQPALANRFCHIEFRVSQTDWLTRFQTGNFTPLQFPKLPDNWRDLARIRYYPLLFSFLSTHRMWIDWLSNQNCNDLDYNQLSRGWPSRRSWDMAAKAMAACAACKLGEDAVDEALIGCVGQEAAIAFSNWYNSMNIPTTEELLEALLHDRYYWPKGIRPDHVLVLVTSLMSAIADQPTPDRLLLLESFLMSTMDKGFKEIVAMIWPTFYEIVSRHGYKPSQEFLSKSRSFAIKALKLIKRN